MLKLRIGALALFAMTAGLAACSLSPNSQSDNNPLSGVTIIQPTTTPATPTPPPTPMPGPMAVEAIQDSGFESGGFTAGWTACSIPHVAYSASPAATPFAVVPSPAIGAAVVSASSASFQVAATPAPANTPAILAGSHAAFTYSGTGAETTYTNAGANTGTAGASGVCQAFTVPASASLTMMVNEGGSDTGLAYADQEADLILPNGTLSNLFFELQDPQASSGGSATGATWVQKGPYALTGAPYNLTPGTSATLFIGTFDKEPSAKYGVYMFVDNVSVSGVTTSASVRRR